MANQLDPYNKSVIENIAKGGGIQAQIAMGNRNVQKKQFDSQERRLAEQAAFDNMIKERRLAQDQAQFQELQEAQLRQTELDNKIAAAEKAKQDRADEDARVAMQIEAEAIRSPEIAKITAYNDSDYVQEVMRQSAEGKLSPEAANKAIIDYYPTWTKQMEDMQKSKDDAAAGPFSGTGAKPDMLNTLYQQQLLDMGIPLGAPVTPEQSMMAQQGAIDKFRSGEETSYTSPKTGLIETRTKSPLFGQGAVAEEADIADQSIASFYEQSLAEQGVQPGGTPTYDQDIAAQQSAVAAYRANKQPTVADNNYGDLMIPVPGLGLSPLQRAVAGQAEEELTVYDTAGKATGPRIVTGTLMKYANALTFGATPIDAGYQEAKDLLTLLKNNLRAFTQADRTTVTELKDVTERIEALNSGILKGEDTIRSELLTLDKWLLKSRKEYERYASDAKVVHVKERNEYKQRVRDVDLLRKIAFGVDPGEPFVPPLGAPTAPPGQAQATRLQEIQSRKEAIMAELDGLAGEQ